MDTLRIQTILKKLSHYSGRLDGVNGPLTNAALKDFQKHNRLKVDGIMGPSTEGKLRRMGDMAALAPAGAERLIPFRLTSYYVPTQAVAKGTVWMLSEAGNRLGQMLGAFFASAALEGTAKLASGLLVNVSGKWAKVKGADYADLAEYYHGYSDRMINSGRVPKPPGYFGMRLHADGTVSEIMTFTVVQNVGVGYGVEREGMPKVPFGTVAADIGAVPKSDPLWAKRGGLVPVGTDVWIGQFQGMQLPIGTAAFSDGYFKVNDCGGGIFGAHLDVFAGQGSWATMSGNFPERAYVWFKGCEMRFPPRYDYGLYDE